MNRFNPPELRRLRALLRRYYGARGSFAEQVEAVTSELPPTPGSRLAFLGRVHHELSLEQIGDNVTSPGDFRQACKVLTGDLQSANAQPTPVARNLLSWPLLLVGVGLLLGGLDVSEANLSRLAVLGPLCVMLCLPVILSPGGEPNPVAWAVATVSPIALGYLTNLHFTPAFLWGVLLLQVGLLVGPLIGIRRPLLGLLVSLELAVSALVLFLLSQGYQPDSSGVVLVALVALAFVSLFRLHDADTCTT